MSAPAILRTASIAALAVGVLLALGSWDGLYEELELPQSLPAMGSQIGGVALVAIAVLLWSAASRPELTALAALTGALAEGGAAAVIAGWLLFRDRIDMPGLGDLGEVLLIGVAVVLAVLAAAQAWIALNGLRQRAGD